MNIRNNREYMAEELYQATRSLNGVLPPYELTNIIRDTLSQLKTIDRAIIYAMIQQKLNLQNALYRFQ